MFTGMADISYRVDALNLEEAILADSSGLEPAKEALIRLKFYLRGLADFAHKGKLEVMLVDGRARTYLPNSAFQSAFSNYQVEAYKKGESAFSFDLPSSVARSRASRLKISYKGLDKNSEKIIRIVNIYFNR